jgi:hypothetical protein
MQPPVFWARIAVDVPNQWELQTSPITQLPMMIHGEDNARSWAAYCLKYCEIVPSPEALDFDPFFCTREANGSGTLQGPQVQSKVQRRVKRVKPKRRGRDQGKEEEARKEKPKQQQGTENTTESDEQKRPCR